MNMYQVFIQIIIESIPVSSSGHLLLVKKLGLIGLNDDTMSNYFLLHIPAIFIFFLYFFKDWFCLLFQRPLFLNFYFWMVSVFLADSITFLFWTSSLCDLVIVEHYFLPFGFMITAWCLYQTKKYNRNQTVTVQHNAIKEGCIFGVVQALSLMPGISRFASTYLTGLYLEYKRKDAFAVSFLMQFPLLCAAVTQTVMTHRETLVADVMLFDFYTIVMLLIATGVSFLVLYAVAMLIERNWLWYFSFYMIIPIAVSGLSVVKGLV